MSDSTTGPRAIEHLQSSYRIINHLINDTNNNLDDQNMQVKSEPRILNQCFTCLCQSEDCIQISSNAIDSKSVTVVEMLTKHFWFQRDEFTDAQHVICDNCWNRLDDFHRFYQEVEQNHRTMNWKPSEPLNGEEDVGTHSRIDIKGDDSRVHSEIEIKEEPSWHQSEAVESDNEDSTASSWKEPREVRFSDQEIESKRKALSEVAIEEEEDDWLHYEVEIQEEDSRHLSEDGAESENEDSTAFSSNGEPNENLIEPRLADYTVDSKRRSLEADSIINTHRQYNCTICEKHCRTFHQLKVHIEKVHKTREGVMCCGRRYTTRLSLLEHVLKLEDPNRFKCDICGKVLANSKAVRTHKQEVHVTGEARIYHCDQCPRRFVRARALTYHRKEHSKEDTTRKTESKTCPHCQKEFRSVFATNRHIKLRHECGDFVCDVCNKTFASERNLRRHMMFHKLSVEELRAQCSICHQWFKTKNSLANHTLLHTAPKKCDICGLVLQHRQALARHKREKHRTD